MARFDAGALADRGLVDDSLRSGGVWNGRGNEWMMPFGEDFEEAARWYEGALRGELREKCVVVDVKTKRQKDASTWRRSMDLMVTPAGNGVF